MSLEKQYEDQVRVLTDLAANYSDDLSNMIGDLMSDIFTNTDDMESELERADNRVSELEEGFEEIRSLTQR